MEKVNNQIDVNIFNRTGKLNATNPLKKIPNVKEKYDSMESKFYVERLNRITPAQKTEDLKKHLQKFDDFKEEQDQKIMAATTKETENNKRISMNHREIKLNKLHRVINFSIDWAREGNDNWKKNIKVQLERERKDREFKIRQIKISENIGDRGKQTQQKEMIDQIDKFEKQFLQDQDKSHELADNEMDRDNGNILSIASHKDCPSFINTKDNLQGSV